ncbi:Leucine zipper protein 2 [Fukomys damarensis]|uniref:Leucine zipper protein 2 n=1 Tax=Fukomys damarensis TaxID=885580 RepID=A0A091D0D0_FUKDA|nr:Leucine zipper protein 2 [Fukomys damarensis]
MNQGTIPRFRFASAPQYHNLSVSLRQDHEELQERLKEVFKERSTILRQLTKTSRELDGIKVNLQVRRKLISLTAKDKQAPD